MKIVHVIPTLSIGGAENFTVELCNQLADLGQEVSLIVLFKSSNDMFINRVDYKVNLIQFGYSTQEKYKVFKRLYSLLKQIEPDVLNTHLSATFYVSPYLFVNNTRCFHTLHNEAEKEANFFVTKLNAILFSRKKVQPIGISNDISYSAKRLYNLSKITTIMNGSSMISVDEKIELMINSGLKSFISVARLEPQKNHNLLLDVLESRTDIHLFICGANPDTEYSRKLLKRIQSSNNVDYLGVVSNIGSYLGSADCLIFTSNFEGLPISLLQAMSIGIPCVSTPVGGIPEVLGSQLGFVSESIDKKSINSAIDKFMSLSDEDLCLLSLNVKKEFSDKYSIKRTANSYISAYR